MALDGARRSSRRLKATESFQSMTSVVPLKKSWRTAVDTIEGVDIYSFEDELQMEYFTSLEEPLPRKLKPFRGFDDADDSVNIIKHYFDRFVENFSELESQPFEPYEKKTPKKNKARVLNRRKSMGPRPKKPRSRTSSNYLHGRNYGSKGVRLIENKRDKFEAVSQNNGDGNADDSAANTVFVDEESAVGSAEVPEDASQTNDSIEVINEPLEIITISDNESDDDCMMISDPTAPIPRPVQPTPCPTCGKYKGTARKSDSDKDSALGDEIPVVTDGDDSPAEADKSLSGDGNGKDGSNPRIETVTTVVPEAVESPVPTILKQYPGKSLAQEKLCLKPARAGMSTPECPKRSNLPGNAVVESSLPAISNQYSANNSPDHDEPYPKPARAETSRTEIPKPPSLPGLPASTKMSAQNTVYASNKHSPRILKRKSVSVQSQCSSLVDCETKPISRTQPLTINPPAEVSSKMHRPITNTPESSSDPSTSAISDKAKIPVSPLTKRPSVSTSCEVFFVDPKPIEAATPKVQSHSQTTPLTPPSPVTITAGSPRVHQVPAKTTLIKGDSQIESTPLSEVPIEKPKSVTSSLTLRSLALLNGSKSQGCRFLKVVKPAQSPGAGTAVLHPGLTVLRPVSAFGNSKVVSTRVEVDAEVKSIVGDIVDFVCRKETFPVSFPHDSPLPAETLCLTGPCRKEQCLLGCVCVSLSKKSVRRARCRNVECVFGCKCDLRNVGFQNRVVASANRRKQILSSVSEVQVSKALNVAEPIFYPSKTLAHSKPTSFSSAPSTPAVTPSKPVTYSRTPLKPVAHSTPSKPTSFSFAPSTPADNATLPSPATHYRSLLKPRIQHSTPSKPTSFSSAPSWPTSKPSAFISKTSTPSSKPRPSDPPKVTPELPAPTRRYFGREKVPIPEQALICLTPGFGYVPLEEFNSTKVTVRDPFQTGKTRGFLNVRQATDWLNSTIQSLITGSSTNLRWMVANKTMIETKQLHKLNIETLKTLRSAAIAQKGTIFPQV